MQALHAGSVPGQGTKIPTCLSDKKKKKKVKQKQDCSKFNEDFKNGPHQKILKKKKKKRRTSSALSVIPNAVRIWDK